MPGDPANCPGPIGSVTTTLGALAQPTNQTKAPANATVFAYFIALYPAVPVYPFLVDALPRSSGISTFQLVLSAALRPRARLGQPRFPNRHLRNGLSYRMGPMPSRVSIMSYWSASGH